MSADHFNRLTPAEAERLACLAEEAAEVIQCVTKILRHGYDSVAPNGETNRKALMREMGDYQFVERLMGEAGDIEPGALGYLDCDRAEKVRRYSHHNKYLIGEIDE